MQRWISVGISGRSKAGVVETVVVLVDKTCVLGVGSSGILDTNSIADIKVPTSGLDTPNPGLSSSTQLCRDSLQTQSRSG
jgi:hypothetical protein